MSIRLPVIAFAFVMYVANVEAQLTFSNPMDASATPVWDRMVERVSLTQSGQPHLVDQTQIRVKVRYLMVDAATRNKIYRAMEVGKLRHLGPSRNDEELGPAVNNQGDTGTANIASCRVSVLTSATTCRFDSRQAESFVSQVGQSDLSEVRPAPTIFLLNGKQAEMNDMAQHPFLIEMRGDADSREPVIKVFDAGTQLRLTCSRNPTNPSTLELTAEVTCSRIDRVDTEMLFGVGDEPVEVKVPHHLVQVVRVSDSISAGDLLMIDPHVRSSKIIQHETRMPMVGKLPYVGQNFTNQQAVEVQQYLIVLLEPGLVP